MWPVAPKISHTLGVGGLASEGGSVLGGRERRAGRRCEEGEVGSRGEVAAIAAVLGWAVLHVGVVGGGGGSALWCFGRC